MKKLWTLHFRLPAAVWFSILEALPPRIAARAADNIRDLGALYSDNPYCQHLCNTLAGADLDYGFDFRKMMRAGA